MSGHRTSTLHMRLTGEELVAMRTAATAAGHASLSSWIRCIAYEAAATSGSGREIATAIADLRADAGRIGNNLNQLAHQANRGLIPDAVSLDVALREFRLLASRADRTLRRVRPVVPVAVNDPEG